LETVAEANALLNAAGMAALAEGELADLAFVQQPCEPALPEVSLPRPQANQSNLPAPLTSFVGRRRELAELRSLLATTRLLTLAGAGGTGKTRLAMQLGTEMLTSFAAGVWLVDLAPLNDPKLVLPAVAATFSVREVPGITPSQSNRWWSRGATFSEREVPGITLLDLVANSLRNKRLLLILDNCEHLVEVCAQLADTLLRACPRLQIVATSREAFGIGGETVYLVPSLAVPDSAQQSLDTLRQWEAIHLFLDRAVAAQPRFLLTASNAAAVVQICRQLDGIPLAIELAAARLRLLSSDQIATRLDDRFRLLNGGNRAALPRQQTLRALFDWSYELLSEAERTLFQQLSVFAGGWTIEAVEAICGEGHGNLHGTLHGDGEVLERFAQLVNKSLVVANEQEGYTRYHLLETIRQYAHEKLAETKDGSTLEMDRARNRHLAYYLQLAEAWMPRSWGRHQVRQLDQFAVEHDNFRAALHWGAKHNADVALRLAAALCEFWARRGYHSEGRAWLQSLLDEVSHLPPLHGEAAKARRAAQATAFLGLSTLVMAISDLAAALTYRETAVRLYRELGDRNGLARTLGLLAHVALLQGQMSEAEDALSEAITLGRETGDKFALSSALAIQGRFLLATSGDLEAARRCSTEGARLARETELPMAMAHSIVTLAGIAAYAGEWDEARAHIREAMALFDQLGDRYRFNTSQSELAHIERRAGNVEEAKRLYRQSIVIWQEFGQRAAIAHELECFAFLARAQTQCSRAACLLGAAQAFRAAIGSAMTRQEEGEYQREVRALYAQMGTEAAALQWATGSTMTVEEAIAFALE
jgi:predicted ATPase